MLTDCGYEESTFMQIGDGNKADRSEFIFLLFCQIKVGVLMSGPSSKLMFSSIIEKEDQTRIKPVHLCRSPYSAQFNQDPIQAQFENCPNS
jgi:hypothetical protein